MTILAVVPYAGSKKLVAMTDRMLESFQLCAAAIADPINVVAINNAADAAIKTKVTWHGFNDKNEGFGNAVNLAIQREVFDMVKQGFPDHVTHVLVLNNDLEFPDPQWLRELLDELEEVLVVTPCTNVTATKVAVAEAARDADSIRANQVSAFCWLVPVATIKRIRKKFGFNLFHPEFSNYGSDDVTSAILRSLLGPKPFKVVPRSFIRHLKAQTANELGIKAGTKELLTRIANYKRARRLA